MVAVGTVKLSPVPAELGLRYSNRIKSKTIYFESFIAEIHLICFCAKIEKPNLNTRIFTRILIDASAS